jgi:hypothetical protein
LRRRKTHRRSIAACAAVLCLSACGSGGERHTAPPPTLPRSLAQALAARTDAVTAALTAGDSCRASALAHRLQRDTIASINSGRVATALQEPLSGAVNDLAGRIVCVPPPPQEEHGRGKHKVHDKKHEGGD